MKILFISRTTSPHVGGVERHIEKISELLTKSGHDIKTISEDNIKYPHLKFLGLLYIWVWIFRNRNLITQSDIIHVHDVFIWYLPFKFFYKYKKFFVTIHGLEWATPLKKFSLLQKRMAVLLSNGSIGVGKFLEKYIGVKFNKIIYGGVSNIRKFDTKVRNSALYVGRLEKDTGLLEFLRYLKSHPNLKVDFVGDGTLRKQCEKYGKVYGFCDPTPFYRKAETVVPSGYLTYLEAKSYRAKIMTFYSTQLKKEYWEEIKKIKTFPTWDEVTAEYIKLWKKNSI